MSLKYKPYIKFLPLVLFSWLVVTCSQPAPVYQSLQLQYSPSTAGYVYLDTFPSAWLDSSFTWEFWFRIDSLGPDAPAILMFPNITLGNEFAIYLDPARGTDIIVAFHEELYRAGGSASVLDGQFHYLACTYSAAGVLQLFVDGSRILNKNLNTTLSITGRKVLIGGDWDPGANYPDNTWTGLLDEVRFWQMDLPASEISFHSSHPDKLLQHLDPQMLGALKLLWRFNTTDTLQQELINESPQNSLLIGLRQGRTGWSLAATGS